MVGAWLIDRRVLAVVKYLRNILSPKEVLMLNMMGAPRGLGGDESGSERPVWNAMIMCIEKYV